MRPFWPKSSERPVRAAPKRARSGRARAPSGVRRGPQRGTDGLNRVTTYTYAYGSGKGDLTQITYPDGSTDQFQYDGTFHHLTRYQNTLNQVTTLT